MEKWHEKVEKAFSDLDYYKIAQEGLPPVDDETVNVPVGIRIELSEVSLERDGQKSVWSHAKQKIAKAEGDIDQVLDGEEFANLGTLIKVVANDQYESGNIKPIGWFPLRVLSSLYGSEESEFEWYGATVVGLVSIPKDVWENRSTRWSQEAIKIEKEQDIEYREAQVQILSGWGLTVDQISELVSFEVWKDGDEIKYEPENLPETDSPEPGTVEFMKSQLENSKRIAEHEDRSSGLIIERHLRHYKSAKQDFTTEEWDELITWTKEEIGINLNDVIQSGASHEAVINEPSHELP